MAGASSGTYERLSDGSFVYVIITKRYAMLMSPEPDLVQDLRASRPSDSLPIIVIDPFKDLPIPQSIKI